MRDEKRETAAVQVDADYSLEAVPASARKGFWNMFFVMLGFTFFSASMSVGAKLGNGLDLSGFAWACLIGGVILSAYCGVLAFIGSRTGLNMDLLCRRTFGAKGSYLSSAILGFTQIGWFGVGVAMFSIPAAELMGAVRTIPTMTETKMPIGKGVSWVAELTTAPRPFIIAWMPGPTSWATAHPLTMVVIGLTIISTFVLPAAKPPISAPTTAPI